MKKSHEILSWLIMLLGAIHIYFASCYGRVDEDVLWFIGAGLAIVFAGLINLIKARSDERIVKIVCIFTNSLMTLLFSFSLIVLQSPQVYIGIALFGAALLLSLQSVQYQKKNNPV